MSEEAHLELAVRVFGLYLQEVGDNIVSESFKASDLFVRTFSSNAFVSVSIEVCAFFLHHLSRMLPNTDGDYLNECVYGPLVGCCAQTLGKSIEKMQGSGAFGLTVPTHDGLEGETTTSIFSSEDVEAETRSTVEQRDAGYANSMPEETGRHASKIIADLLGEEKNAMCVALCGFELAKSLARLDFAFVSHHMQEILTPELIESVRREA